MGVAVQVQDGEAVQGMGGGGQEGHVEGVGEALGVVGGGGKKGRLVAWVGG